MTNKAVDLRNALADAKILLATAEANVFRMEQTCLHNWGPVRDNPIHKEGYQTQDLMGHFTTDQYGNINAPMVYVPPTKTPRWTRTCNGCGKEEHTFKTTEVITQVPKF